MQSYLFVNIMLLGWKLFSELGHLASERLERKSCAVGSV